ncbi:MAG: hypothetical protein U9N62_06375 [Thermotogota bacterium]|nr:hypothetical protein [Thermotogota bacterium]
MSNQLHTQAQKICDEYIKHFPMRKIWISEKFGKRISCIASKGRELFTKPHKINLTERFIIFIEDQETHSKKVSQQEKQFLQKLFDTYIRESKTS